MHTSGKVHKIVMATHCAYCEALIEVSKDVAVEIDGQPNTDVLCKICLALVQGALTQIEKVMLNRAAEKAVVVGKDGSVVCSNCVDKTPMNFELKFVGDEPHRALVTCVRCLCTFEVLGSNKQVEPIAPDGFIPFISDAIAALK